MDKKNTTIGVLLLLGAFALMYFGAKTTPPPPAAPEIAKSTSGSPIGENQAPSAVTSALPARSPDNAEFAALAATDTTAKILTIGNDHIQVRLSDFGGAVENVALVEKLPNGQLQYPAFKDKPDPYIFNQLHVDPILAIAPESFPGLDRSKRYDVVSQTAREVVFRAIFENRIEVTRRYSVPGSDVQPGKGDPYQLRHETTFRNLTQETLALPRVALSLGTAAPVSPNDMGQYLNVATYNGDDLEVIARTDLEGGGFLSNFGIGSKQPKPYVETTTSVVWAAAKNQFFASLVTPDQPGVGTIARRVSLPPFPGSTVANVGITGSLRFDVKPLAPQAAESLGMNLYVGPKENHRLEQLGKNQNRIMQFDYWFFNRIFFSRFISPFLLWLMNFCYSWVHNYGLAIIVMTLILKTLFLPLTLAAARSSKRMVKIQPQMQAIREKYKDSPQKMNQATMELFKEHKVNPMGGCLPILITIPFFVGFFVMLQSASELRYAEFLWAKDLSAPDTIGHIWGIPINIMPILMGATMILQMRLSPMPSTDNAQAKMFKFMPYFFALVCYNFSCALALYSTVGNIFTIGQQLVINRMKDPEVTPAAPAGGSRAMKNVTPAKKKGK